MLKLNDALKNRVQDGLKKYARIVAMGRERGVNERDTGDIVRAMLGDMLGYDPFFDVTTETSVRGPHAEFAVQTEGRTQFLVLIKPLGVIPHAAHLLRMSGAGAPPYADWILLTNAETWACYRLGVGLDRHPELVFRVSLTDGQSAEEKIALFFLLCKEGVQQEALSQYWEQTRVLHPGRLAALLLSDESLQMLRRELMRTFSYRVDLRTLRERLLREVLRPEILSQTFAGDLNSPRHPQCFAYIRDPNDPESWRMRYRNSDGTPNADWLTQAVTDLGQDARALGIPADDVPLVKGRLRQAFAELGISPDELPPLLRM